MYAYESEPPEHEEPVEWRLITNLPVTTVQEACEKVAWYCLRWRIERYFKVLKSGFNVEDCRLATGDRLTRYLTVMSVVAWRLFMITLIARTAPATPCTEFLPDPEWKVLFRCVNKGKPLPHAIPAVRDVVVWIARLGGYLARKHDGVPGTPHAVERMEATRGPHRRLAHRFGHDELWVIESPRIQTSGFPASGSCLRG